MLGSPTEPQARIVSYFLPAGRFACFDAAVTLRGDMDGERGVLEAVTAGVSDDWIADDFGPVIQRELSGEQGQSD